MRDDQPQDNSQDTALLSWRMPMWKRAIVTLLYLLACVLFVWAFAMALPIGCGHTYRDTLIALPLAFVFAVIWGLSSKVIVALDLGNEGVAAEVWVGFRVARAPLADVEKLDCKPAWLASLRMKGSWYFLLGLPEPVLHHLIAVLREASNARIIGFD